MTNQITTINETEIVTVENDGTIYVPIRPLCNAIGIDPEGQRQRIMRHYILSSVAFTLKATGTDGKSYDMLCLPLEYVYGWLFTIDANLVDADIRDNVATYQRECYEVLYKHFTVSMRHTIETNKAEIQLLEEIRKAQAEENEAKGLRRQAEATLAKLRKERLNPQPKLF